MTSLAGAASSALVEEGGRYGTLALSATESPYLPAELPSQAPPTVPASLPGPGTMSRLAQSAVSARTRSSTGDVGGTVLGPPPAYSGGAVAPHAAGYSPQGYANQAEFETSLPDVPTAAAPSARSGRSGGSGVPRRPAYPQPQQQPQQQQAGSRGSYSHAGSPKMSYPLVAAPRAAPEDYGVMPVSSMRRGDRDGASGSESERQQEASADSEYGALQLGPAEAAGEYGKLMLSASGGGGSFAFPDVPSVGYTDARTSRSSASDHGGGAAALNEASGEYGMLQLSSRDPDRARTTAEPLSTPAVSYTSAEKSQWDKFQPTMKMDKWTPGTVAPDH